MHSGNRTWVFGLGCVCERAVKGPINGMVNMRVFIVNKRENIPRVIMKRPKQREKKADMSRVICLRREGNRGRGQTLKRKIGV